MKMLLINMLFVGLIFIRQLVSMPSFLMDNKPSEEDNNIDVYRGESTNFLEFADMMTNFTSNKNVILFRKSISECSITAFGVTHQLDTTRGTKWTSMSLIDQNADYSRLFKFNEKTFGLIGVSQISFYLFKAIMV